MSRCFLTIATWFITLFLLFVPWVATVNASEESPTPAASKGNLNWKLLTGGGKQWWTDELVFHDWRIQRNALTGHCRLLNGKNVRHAWGGFDQCRKKLNQIRRDQELPPMSGKVVIALHGLMRSRSSLNSLSRYLRENGDYTVLPVTYASSRNEIGAHAQALAKIIGQLGDDVEEINFVAHSLGNLVIRHYLADQTDEERGLRPDPRIRRIVMIGPPNNGSEMAVKFGRNFVFKGVCGKSGMQLASGWDELKPRLATPTSEFGVIAGGKGAGKGNNPLLSGDDDLVVSVEETRLVGARDFALLPVAHTFIMNNKKVQEYTLQFFRNGYFISERERQPIVAERVPAASTTR